MISVRVIIYYKNVIVVSVVVNCSFSLTGNGLSEKTVHEPSGELRRLIYTVASDVGLYMQVFGICIVYIHLTELLCFLLSL